MHEYEAFMVKVFLGLAISAFVIIFLITASELIYDTPDLFDLLFPSKKPRIKRLCTEHATSNPKIKGVALLDNKNCDRCKKEKKNI